MASKRDTRRGVSFFSQNGEQYNETDETRNEPLQKGLMAANAARLVSCSTKSTASVASMGAAERLVLSAVIRTSSSTGPSLTIRK
jgi:hypothetical protein